MLKVVYCTVAQKQGGGTDDLKETKEKKNKILNLGCINCVATTYGESFWECKGWKGMKK